MKLGSRRSRCCVLACTIALAVGTPSRALADEQVFVLKNGRKIQGELDGEDATSYTIRTTGGKTVVPKSLVSRIDPVQEQPKGPAGPKPAPDAGKPGGGPSEKGDPGGKAPGAAEAPKPNAPEDEPAANPEPVTPGDMAKARKAIASFDLDKVNASGVAALDAKALDALAKDRSIPGGAWVAILIEDHEQPGLTPEQKVAQELAVRAGRRALAYVAQAVDRTFQGSVPRPALLATASRMRDDRAGTLESVLLARAKDLWRSGTDAQEVVATLGAMGSRRSLAPIFSALLEGSPTPAAVLARACDAIVAREKDPETALAPLASALDPGQLPELGRLALALDLFKYSKGGAARALSKVLDVLETTRPGDAAAKADLTLCVRRALSALASMGSRQAVEKVGEWLDAAEEEHRKSAISALFAVRLAPDTRVPVLRMIVDRMSEERRTKAELQSFAGLLQELTGLENGADPGAWSRYVDGLRDK